MKVIVSVKTNLSTFSMVFTSCAIVNLNKDAFKGHFCQTVDHFVEKNASASFEIEAVIPTHQASLKYSNVLHT